MNDLNIFNIISLQCVKDECLVLNVFFTKMSRMDLCFLFATIMSDPNGSGQQTAGVFAPFVSGTF